MHFFVKSSLFLILTFFLQFNILAQNTEFKLKEIINKEGITKLKNSLEITRAMFGPDSVLDGEVISKVILDMLNTQMNVSNLKVYSIRKKKNLGIRKYQFFIVDVSDPQNVTKQEIKGSMLIAGKNNIIIKIL